MSNMNLITDFKVTIRAPRGTRNMPAYCAEHDCVASLWSDGSGDCEDCRVVETRCECALTACVLVPVDAMEKVWWCEVHRYAGDPGTEPRPSTCCTRP